MKRHNYSIGEVSCGARTKTEARKLTEQRAAEICRDGMLTPTIVWGCPHQAAPLVVAAQVMGFAVFRPDRVWSLIHTGSRESAVSSACVHVAQLSCDPDAGGLAEEHTRAVAAWMRGFDRENARLQGAAADFERWAKWQRAYADEKARGGDDHACRWAAHRACGGAPILM